MPTTTATSPRRLLVDGDLSLSGPTGGQIRISGLGERIEVDIDPSLLTLALVSRLPPRARRVRWLVDGQTALDLAQVHVHLFMGGRPIGRYDWKTTGTVFTRLLGLGPIDLSLRRLLLAVARGPSKQSADRGPNTP